MANVLGIRLECVASEQGPGLGGAMLAMVACGAYSSVEAAAEKMVAVSETVEPEAELTALYEKRYQKFKKIYPACKELFAALKEEN